MAELPKAPARCERHSAVQFVAALARRIIVLHHGAMLSDGTPDHVFQDERVIQAYLGTKFAARMAKTLGRADGTVASPP